MTFMEDTTLKYLNLGYSGQGSVSYKEVLGYVLLNTNESKSIAKNKLNNAENLSTSSNNRTNAAGDDDFFIESSPNEGQVFAIKILNEFLASDYSMLRKLAFLIYLTAIGFMRSYRKYLVIPDDIVNTYGEKISDAIDRYLAEKDKEAETICKSLYEKYPILNTLNRNPGYLMYAHLSHIHDYLTKNDDILDNQSEEIYEEIKKLQQAARQTNKNYETECREKLGYGSDGNISTSKPYRLARDACKYDFAKRFPDSIFATLISVY